MRSIMSFGKFAVIIAVAAGVARAEDWTTGYASLGRTSYLPGVMVAPPFALAWEYASPKPLKGGALVAVQRAFVSDESFHVWSLSLADGTVAWKHDEPRAPDEVKCYDAMSGALRWSARVDGNLIHTPQIGQAFVYAATSNGSLYAFNQLDGKQAWKVSLATPLTLAAADGNLVVIGAGAALVGLNTADGAQAFSVDLGTPPSALPALAADGAFVSLGDRIVAVDRAGAKRWEAALTRPAWAAPAVTKAGVLAGCTDGSVVLLNRADGKPVWEVVLAGVPNTVGGAGDVAYVGTRQGTVVGLRLADGAKLWSASLGKGPVDGIALADGRLVVTAGTWVGALLPAPEAPGQLALAKHGKAADLTWAAPAANGSALSAYRVFRRRSGEFAPVALVPASAASFADGLLPGEVDYVVSAVAANGAESARSAAVSTLKGAPLIQRASLGPLPLDSRSGLLHVSVTLRDAARVTWNVLDAEGKALTEERTVMLPQGDSTLDWDGADRSGRPADPGVYKVSLSAKAADDEDALARAFPITWAFDGGNSALAGAVPGQNGQAAGVGGGPVGGGTSGGSPTGAGSPPGVGGGTDGTGTGNNGVRDHGQGEGRDDAGQGTGQGSDHGKK